MQRGVTERGARRLWDADGGVSEDGPELGPTSVVAYDHVELDNGLALVVDGPSDESDSCPKASTGCATSFPFAFADFVLAFVLPPS